jgi:hypothetical protein
MQVRTAAVEELTSTNAFRILGLEISASLPAIVARSNELQTLLKINRVPSYPNDLPLFPPPDRSLETIAAVAHRLDSPATRLQAEATWFHRRTPIDTAALTALQEKKTAQALTLWARAAAQAPRPDDRLHYQHNIAVLRLCLSEMGTNVADSAPKAWQEVLSSWLPILTSNDFWRTLVAASPIGTDPRCQPTTPDEIRDFVGVALARAVERRAIHAAKAEDYQAAADWLALLQEGEFPAVFAEAAKLEFAASLVENIQAQIKEISSQLKAAREVANSQKAAAAANSPAATASGDLEEIDANLERRLASARILLDMLIATTSTSHPTVLSVTDILAETHQSVGGYYGTYRHDPERAHRITEAGLRFAVSEGVRAALGRELRVTAWNLAFPRLLKAIEAKDYGKAQAAFKELETLVDTEDEAKLVQSYRQPLSFLRVTRDGTPIKKVPTLSRINGFGTWLAGRSDTDNETSTYVSNLYFTALFIPLFVIARYRVSDAGDESYHFFSKQRLTQGQKAWNVVLGLAMAIAIIVGMASEQTKPNAKSPSPYRSSTPSAPYAAPSAPPSPAPPSPRSSPRALLAAEIDRRRPLLELEQAAVDKEAETIRREENALTDLRADIESRRSLYPNGLPPTEYAQDQAEVQEYNQEAQALKFRINQYDRRADALERSIDEFNDLVRQHNSAR